MLDRSVYLCHNATRERVRAIANELISVLSVREKIRLPSNDPAPSGFEVSPEAPARALTEKLLYALDDEHKRFSPAIRLATLHSLLALVISFLMLLLGSKVLSDGIISLLFPKAGTSISRDPDTANHDSPEKAEVPYTLHVAQAVIVLLFLLIFREPFFRLTSSMDDKYPIGSKHGRSLRAGGSLFGLAGSCSMSGCQRSI